MSLIEQDLLSVLSLIHRAAPEGSLHFMILVSSCNKLLPNYYDTFSSLVFSNFFYIFWLFKA